MASEPIVLTCTFVTLGSTVGGDLRSGKSLDPKKIVGGFLAMTLCAVVAEVDGELGAGLAIAIAGTAFVKYGIPALSSPGYTKGGLNDPTGYRSAATQRSLGQPTDAQVKKYVQTHKSNPLAGLLPFTGPAAFQTNPNRQGARQVR